MADAPLDRLTAALDPEAPEATMLDAVAAAGGCEERARPDGGTDLVFWVPSAEADRVAETLRGLTGVRDVRAEPQDDGWRDALHAFHTPVRVAGRLLVRPPWADADPALGDVLIDPGMAFGTGQHATTRGCLELLCDVGPGALLDVGCGSGILSIAACRLGFRPVVAVDFDPLCVDATTHNARVNGVDVDVRRLTVGEDDLPPADVVAANLTSGLLAVLAGEMAARPPRAAVLSGLRPADADDVLAAWAPLGLRPAGRRDADGWTALLVAV